MSQMVSPVWKRNATCGISMLNDLDRKFSFYECISRTITKRIEIKRERNYTGMPRAILIKFWIQPTPPKISVVRPLTSHLTNPQVRRIRHVKLCWIIFIIQVYQTIVLIFIVIFITFRQICPPAFFRCLSNSGASTKHRTTSFIQSTRVDCSDSANHNWV